MALAVLCVLDLALIAPRLLVPDLNLDYPFMDGDSWDWIANGLRFAGAGVRFSGRPPLLPLVIALLERLSLLPWLPVLLQAVFAATVVVFYRLASRLAPRPAAFAAAAALLLGHSLWGMSLQIMADVPASCLLFFALRSFLLAGLDRSPRRYAASGGWAAASALAQPAALLILFPAAVTVLAHRRRDLRSPWLAAGGALLLGVPLLATAALRRWGPDVGPALDHWRLVRPHGDSLLFYLWSAGSLLGLPGAVLAAAGAGAALRDARRDDTSLFIVSLTGLILAFFVFLYDFNAQRFLVYASWPLGLLTARALGRVPSGVPRAAAATLLLAGALLPTPSFGNDSSWIGLWPLPPIYAHAAFDEAPTGSPRLAVRGISAHRFPASVLAGFSIPARVRGASLPPHADRPAPAAVEADASALFVAAGAADGGGRYRVVTRLGNALRQRVAVVPASWLGSWRQRLGLAPAGRIGTDYALFRARVPCLPGSWLLAFAGASPQAAQLQAGAETAPRACTPELRRAVDRALAVRRLAGRHDPTVALFPPGFPAGRSGDPLRLYLPFLLGTTELRVIEPDEVEPLLQDLRQARVLSEQRVGRTVVRWIVYQRRRVLLVR